MPFVRDGLKARIHLGRPNGPVEVTRASSCRHVPYRTPGRGSPIPPGQTARSAACLGHPGLAARAVLRGGTFGGDKGRSGFSQDKVVS